jgi:hypothetical protein
MGLQDPALTTDVKAIDISEVHDDAAAPRKSQWLKIREIVWDGERSPEERKLVQRLDLFILYGYCSSSHSFTVLTLWFLLGVGQLMVILSDYWTLEISVSGIT